MADPTTQNETRERLLDAAELLFAQKGWSGASIREITQAAGVNVAAAHYHFGNKQALLAAVLERHSAGLARKRLALLNAAEAHGPPSLEAIVEAFVAPILAEAEDPERGAALIRLVGRSLGDTEGPWRRVVDSAPVEQLRARFVGALSRRLGGLTHEQVLWRLQFMMGSLVHVLMHGDLIRQISGGTLDPDDLGRVRSELIAFLVGGLDAPSPPA